MGSLFRMVTFLEQLRGLKCYDNFEIKGHRGQNRCQIATIELYIAFGGGGREGGLFRQFFLEENIYSEKNRGMILFFKFISKLFQSLC